MKNIFKKISLLLIICSLIVPNCGVSAEEINGEKGPESTPTVTPSVPTVTPSVPEVTPNVPEVKPEPTPEVVKKSDDATLKELKVEGASLKTDFTSNNFEYEAIAKSSTSSVKIKATPANLKAKIDDSSKTGTQQISVGENIFKIKVVAENGKELIYTIKVIRSTADLNLKRLNIQGQKLNEVFDPETYEYTADVTYNVRSIQIQTGKPLNTKVSIKGNSNLKVGKNTVTITVSNASGETKEYKIIVTRSSEEMEEEDEEETSSEDVIITSNSTSDDLEETTDSIKDIEDDNENGLRSVIIITSSVLLLLIAGLGIYFYIRTGDSEAKKQKKINKLKKKQAKIEEQLTGLMPVITEEQEKEYIKKNEEVEELEEENNLPESDTIYDEEELEETIEIKKEDIEENPEYKKRRVDRNIFEEDLDDLFDDRDE